ncbi:MAG: efflux RND transporter periplasmic adaptor subunit [Gemmataceae bacterium]|nr:efflux RND transporter periplasmic adaptor subunit [Gemmataceae bacterium]
MSIRRWLATAGAVALASAGAFAAYRHQDRWVPHLFPGTSAPGDSVPEPDGHDHGGADRVKLSPQAQKNLGLLVDTIEPREYWRTIAIPGSVVDRPGESDRSVPSRVAGIVAEILAKPGDTVKAGDALFVLHLASEYLQGSQTDLVKSARELEIATSRRDRIAEAVKKGTQSGTALIDEESQVKRFTTQVQAYRRQLALFGFSAEQVDRAEKGEIVTQVTVSAPGSPGQVFEVQDLKASLGESVPAGQSLATLANHQKLYVEGRAFKTEAEALARAIRDRLPIRAEFADEAPGAWKPQEPLAIRHLSNQVDPVTRTFAFYLPLENEPKMIERDGARHFLWRYRPGQRVRLRVPVEKLSTPSQDGTTAIPPFVLPAGGVVREGAETYVFVQSGDVFLRKPVHVLHEERDEVVVANDGSVTEADYVVLNRAAALNRALKASAAEGGGHGHDHGHEH